MAALPQLEHVYTEGDTLPELVGVITQTDLTGYTVELKIEKPDGTVLAKTAILTDAANGEFKFTWTATDLVYGTCQLATLTFTTPGGDPQTIRFTMDVARKLS